MKVTALVDGLERTATAPVGMTSTVSCLPAQVVRGEQVTCTLSPAEAVDRLTQWRFVGEDGNEVTDPVKSAVWEGLAVMGGTVFAELEDETPQGSFTITSRDWSSLVVELLVPQWSVTPNTEASFVPLPLEIHDLGHVDFVRSALDYSVLGTVLSGPNANYIYLTGLPYHVTATIHVHPQLAENTDFFNAQFAYDAGPGKCRQDDVLPFLPVLLAHEGTLREPTSHVGLFEAELEELGGQLVEDAVGYNSAQSIEDAAHAGFTPLFQAADDESARADSEFFPSYCEFRYVYQ